MRNIDGTWFRAAAIRMIRTIAQTILGMITIGAALDEINWSYVLSVAIVSGIYSLLTSVVTKLPELDDDGSIEISTSKLDEDENVYQLVLNDEIEALTKKKSIRLMVYLKNLS